MKYAKLFAFTVVAGLVFVACSESSSSKDAKVVQAKVNPKSADSDPQKKFGKDDTVSAQFSQEEWEKILLIRSLLREAQIVFEQVWAKVEPETTRKKLSVFGELRSRLDASFSESGQELLKKAGVTCDTEKHMVLKTSTDPVSKIKEFVFFKHSCGTDSDMSELAKISVLSEDFIQLRLFNEPVPKAAGRMGSFLEYKTDCAIKIKGNKYLAALSCQKISQDTGPISHTLFEVMQLTEKGEVFVKGQKFENIFDMKESFELKIPLEGEGVYLYETFEDEVPEMMPTFSAINEPGLESNPQEGEYNGQKEESNKEESGQKGLSEEEKRQFTEA